MNTHSPPRRMAALLRRMAALLLALGLLLIIHGTARAAKTFRWKLSPGESFRVQMTQNMKTTVKRAGNDVNSSNEMVMQMTWRVEKVNDDGTVNVAQTIDRIKMAVDMPGQGQVKYDSDSPEAPEADGAMLGNMFRDMLGPMVGARIVQTMNTRGEILDVRIDEEVLASLESNPMMKQMFSEESFKEMAGKGAAVFPQAAIEEGHAWKIAAEINNPAGKMKADTSYVYQGEEERDGRILDRFRVDLILAFAEDAGMPGMKIKLKDQDCSGTMYFDNRAGRLVETQITQKMTMEVDMGGQQMDQAIETTMRLTVEPIR